MFDLYKNIRKNIAEFGSSVIGVAGEDEPSFAYTIGLSEKYGTELIILGVNPRYGMQFLNYIKDEILEKGIALEAGTPTEVGANYPAVFRECEWAKVKYYGVQAFEYYERDDIKFVQVVMPDAKGKFPDDPDFDVSYMGKRQPLLYNVEQARAAVTA